MLHVLEGHTDFVKSITILPSPKPLLLSTSSDRTIRLWDLTPLSSRATPGCVQMIREQHTRPVECAAWRLDIEAEDAFPSVWTADSLGVIKRWMLEKGSLAFVADVPGHVTSVARIVASDDGLWSGKASPQMSARC